MSNRKMMSPEKELREQDKSESIELIKRSLTSLDEAFEIETPGLEWFEQMVVVQKEAAQKRLMKEVIVFIVVALIIVSFVLFTLYKLPIFFLALQGIATIFIMAYSAKHYVKQVDEG